jgi:hypothetical protein
LENEMLVLARVSFFKMPHRILHPIFHEALDCGLYIA